MSTMERFDTQGPTANRLIVRYDHSKKKNQKCSNNLLLFCRNARILLRNVILCINVTLSVGKRLHFTIHRRHFENSLQTNDKIEKERKW